MLQKVSKAEPAWFGIDSFHARYLTGTKDDIQQGLIAPKETAAIIERAYTMFKSERLFVKSECASSFLIRNVFVGQQRGAIVGHEPIITEPFAVKFEALADLKFAFGDVVGEGKTLKIEVDKPALDFIGAPFPLPSMQVGMDLTFQVENIGKTSMRFLGALLGQAVWL